MSGLQRDVPDLRFDRRFNKFLRKARAGDVVPHESRLRVYRKACCR
jgi:hypothetical protein